MKNNNSTEEFDLFVKRSLQDAEAEPSPRVWQAIESRLGTSAAQAGGFRWAWAAVAVAAAVAAAIFIPANFDNSNLPHNVMAQELLSLASPSSEIAIADIPAPRAINNLYPSRHWPSSAEQTLAQAGETITLAASEAEESAAVAAVPQKNGEESATKPEVEPQRSIADILDEMAAGEVRRKSPVRISAYLSSGIGGNETGAKATASAAGGNPAYIENDIKELSASNYSIPLSVGAGVRFHLSDKFAIGTGLNYTFLSRSFSGTYTSASEPIPVVGDIRHDMRYIGVPLNLFYNVYDGKGFRFYVLGTGEAEWCLGNSYTMRANGQTKSEKVAGTQLSTGLGFGVEFKLNHFIGLYIDPSVRYYFDSGHPNNVRSESPLMANFDAGLRFNF